MAAAILIFISASVIFVLGVVHLLYTFTGVKLTPRDKALQLQMQQTSPVITKETTMWRAWIGFNASHSLGAILFGLLYGFFAATQAELLFQSVFLTSVGFVMLSALWLLGKLYWFRTPFVGISLAWLCYVAGIGLRQL